MIQLTTEEQIAELQSMESGLLLHWARPVLVGLTLVLILAGAFSGNFVFYIIALVSCAAALVLGQRVPHISNAAKGLREGIKQNGSVEITIQQLSDSQLYSGLIFMDNQPLWQMEFVLPFGWQPVEGKYPAEIVFIQGVEWPVVVLTKDGLLYQRWKPSRYSLKK